MPCFKSCVDNLVSVFDKYCPVKLLCKLFELFCRPFLMFYSLIKVSSFSFKHIVTQIKKSLIYNHLLQFEHFNCVVDLYSLTPCNILVEYLGYIKFPVKDTPKLSTAVKIGLNWLFRKLSLQRKWTENWTLVLKQLKSLFYFHDIINIIIVAYSLDHTFLTFN